MNPLKKLKLKSQLRNCDYVLAGNVIKQQYYDANKSTVINRLIDEFMADPGFENALKLIEYNEMMVFYFTESCAGGLYIRKQDPYKTGPYTPVTDDTEAQSETSSPMPTMDSPLGISKEEQILSDWKQERQRRILEESQAWMDEMIASGSRKTESSDMPHTNYADESAYSSTTHEEAELDLQETLVMEPIRLPEEEPDYADNHFTQDSYTDYNDEVDSYGNDSYAAYEESHAQPEQTEFEDISASAPELIDESIESVYTDTAKFTPEDEPFSSSAFAQEPFDTAEHQAAAADEQHDPYMQEPAPAAAAPPKTKRRSYDNVIATLQIDIHTMTKQLEEYRQELSYFPSNEKQLIAWIHSLETAIEEFSEVIEMLEES